MKKNMVSMFVVFVGWAVHLYMTDGASVTASNDDSFNISTEATSPSEFLADALDANEGPEVTTFSENLKEKMLSSVNFHRMMERNCSVAYMQVSEGQEEVAEKVVEPSTEACVVGLWFQKTLPSWIYPGEDESLLDTLPRALAEEKKAFIEQLCPCKSIQVTKTCPKKVMDALVPFILPCVNDRRANDAEQESDAKIIATLQKAMKDIQLFEDAQTRLNQSNSQV